jgi:hypothetical protein
MKIHHIRRLSSTSCMKGQVYYALAKKGDIEAARKLISTIIHLPDKLHEKSGFVCPVMKPAGNRIPLALAEFFANNTNMVLCDSIFLQNNPHGSSMIERMYYQPSFSGYVKSGNYVIVDDVYTTGQTIKSLKTYIESSGSEVTSAWCIGSGPSLEFEPTRLKLKLLISRFPDITEYFDIHKLTVPQINYLMRLTDIRFLWRKHSNNQLHLMYS